jgi:multiple sugar transport system ATP-binding protein
MVFQSYALYPHLSVAKNLAFPLVTLRRPRTVVEEKVREVAELLQIEALLHRKPKELSGGQRQRVAVGRAIIREPRAFLMDEPLSNLDAKLRTATRHELTRLHRRLESTFIYVTHDQVEAMTMATRIVVMNHGRIEQVGTPSEVYDRPESVFVAGFLGSPPMNLVDVTVRSIAGRVGLVAAGIDADLWDGEITPRDAVLGVRPEHLRVLAAGDEAGAPVRIGGEVLSVENLGSEEIAYCRVGEATVVARGAKPIGVREGDRVTLTADRSDLHLFDRTSGRRLEWVPTTSLSAPTSDQPAAATA